MWSPHGPIEYMIPPIMQSALQLVCANLCIWKPYDIILYVENVCNTYLDCLEICGLFSHKNKVLALLKQLIHFIGPV